MEFFETKELKGKKHFLVCNGTKDGRKGYRALVVGWDGYARVNHVFRNGAKSRQTSFQIAELGARVFKHEFGSESILAFMVEHDGLRELDHRDRSIAMKKLSLLNEEWLEDDSGEDNNQLPAGWGWDGERTGSEISKFERVERFFKELPNALANELRQYILNSKSFDMPTSFRYKGHDLPQELGYASYWVLWLKYGKVTYITEPVGYGEFPRDVIKAMEIHVDRAKAKMNWILYENKPDPRLNRRFR